MRLDRTTRLAAMTLLVLASCPGCGGPGGAVVRSAPSQAADAAESSTPASSVATPSGGPATPGPAGAAATPLASAPDAAAAGAAGSEPTQDELTFSTGGTGKLPGATIRKVLRDKMPAYTACYEKARERMPNLKGRFAACFRIEPSGAVSAVEMRGSRADAAFSACLADEVKALKFPRPKGGVVEVVYPLDFAGD